MKRIRLPRDLAYLGSAEVELETVDSWLIRRQRLTGRVAAFIAAYDRAFVIGNSKLTGESRARARAQLQSDLGTEWLDVLRDPAAWPGLAQCIFFNQETEGFFTAVLELTGVGLIWHLFAQNEAHTRRAAEKWLLQHWREVWDTASPTDQLRIAEYFVARSQQLQERYGEVTAALRKVARTVEDIPRRCSPRRRRVPPSAAPVAEDVQLAAVAADAEGQQPPLPVGVAGEVGLDPQRPAGRAVD